MHSFIRRLAKLPRYLFIGLIRGYQLIVSPHLPSSCRFTPSCSRYAVEAYETFGIWRGTLLTLWRLLRCHPYGGRGYDPPCWSGQLPKRYQKTEQTQPAATDC